MIAEHITNVKLSSFELALEFQSDVTNDCELSLKNNGTKFSTNGKDLPDCSMSSEQKIERYKQLSRASSATREPTKRTYSTADLGNNNLIMLPYTPAFRQYFCEYYYQAPELLTIDKPYVYPSKQTDAYGVTLLLWELLNQCIPFVIYNEAKHTELLSANYPLKYLPIIEEQRCQRFNGIFERVLKREPQTRMDLSKIYDKLNAIEVDIQVENDKKQNRFEDSRSIWSTTKSAEKTHRPPGRVNTPKESHTEKATPDRSTNKFHSVLPSPLSLNSAEKQFSPMTTVNTTTTTTMTNPSPLDYHKVLSPRREINVNLYDRSSTLKRRKKIAQKKNIAQLMDDDDVVDETLQSTTVDEQEQAEDDESVSVKEQMSSEFNNALTKSAISRELSYTQDSVVLSPEKTPTKPVDSENKENVNDSKSYYSNQSLSHDYTLPTIARNNQIRRNNWLSSENLNHSQTHEPVIVAVSHIVRKCDDADVSTSTVKPINDSRRKLNVSIKIVRTQLSPVNSVNHNDSTKSECSLVDDNYNEASSDEEDFSVKSRIKFFRSLESQRLHKRSPLKNRADFSRRSEITFKEAKRANAKTQRLTYPQVSPTRQDLLKQIPLLFADIHSNIDPLLQNEQPEEQTDQLDEMFLNAANDYYDDDRTVSVSSEDLLQYRQPRDNESHATELEKRNSVKRTVQMFESSLRSDKNRSVSFNRSDRKNDSRKSTVEIREIDDNDIVTDEKVENVMIVQEASDAENESGTQIGLAPNAEPVIGANGEHNHYRKSFVSVESRSFPFSESGTVQTKTLIKRTYYQEITTTNDPNVSGSNATIATKSMTTQVTLNMRKCARRASDVGSLTARQMSSENKSISPYSNDARHSIANPVRHENQSDEIVTTSGRQLAQILSSSSSADSSMKVHIFDITSLF